VSPRNVELNQEMRERSRQAWMAAARTVFSQNGYFSCRIADIARQAGMSQGNMYWYFSSKEDLLRAVLAEAFESLGTVMAQAAARPGTARQKVEALLDGLLEYAETGSEFTQIMISLMGQGNEDMFTQLGFDMDHIGAGYTQSVYSILAQAQAEGEIDPHLDPMVVTMMFFGLFNGMNLVYGKDWLRIPPASLKAGINRLFGLI